MDRVDGPNRIMLVRPHSTITARRTCCDGCLPGPLLSITTNLKSARRYQDTVRILSNGRGFQPVF